MTFDVALGRFSLHCAACLEGSLKNDKNHSFRIIIFLHQYDKEEGRHHRRSQSRRTDSRMNGAQAYRYRCMIFEATDAIGGIAQTYNYKGNRIDIGGHRFFSKIDRVMKWWFNILPPQGAPAADTAAKQHEIEYAVQVTMEYLCPEVGVGNDGVEEGLGWGLGLQKIMTKQLK